MLYHWLKRLRVMVALIFLVATLFIFSDIYELLTLSQIKGVVYLQFVPSLLRFIQTVSISATGLFVVLMLTLLVGRVYCSSICPLGIIQDIVTYFARRFSSKKMFFKSKKAINWLRYSILALSVFVTILGFSFVLTLIDPYSIAGRFFTYLVRPLVILLNNGIVAISGDNGSYVIYKMEVILPGAIMLSTTVLFLLVVVYLSFTRGRLYCNTICPVGTFLGLISKVSIFKIRIDNSKCSKCAKCVSVCKSECISLKNQTIDYSRCVSCFNCVAICPDKAVDFKSFRPDTTQFQSRPANTGRRDAIATLTLLAISSKIVASAHQEKTTDGKRLKVNAKKFALSPPGSKSIARFNSICTGCGLCVSACPAKVLRPAVKEYGLVGFMQPHLDYSVSQCNFDCTWCGKVCPTGAILPLTHDAKVTLQIGKAMFVKENCVVYTDETACGACSEHCPTKAVDMVPYKDNLVIPQVNQSICVGCGACEHPCPLPAGYKAIYIEGNPEHLAAQKPVEEKAEQAVQEDFPF